MHVNVQVRFGGGPTEKARTSGTSLAAYPTPVGTLDLLSVRPARRRNRLRAAD